MWVCWRCIVHVKGAFERLRREFRSEPRSSHCSISAPRLLTSGNPGTVNGAVGAMRRKRTRRSVERSRDRRAVGDAKDNAGP